MRYKYIENMLNEIIKGRGDAQRVILNIRHQLKLYELNQDKERINNALKMADDAINSWFEQDQKKKEEVA
jgi:hypothetical protein